MSIHKLENISNSQGPYFRYSVAILATRMFIAALFIIAKMQK
jgi:hypothetical protein